MNGHEVIPELRWYGHGIFFSDAWSTLSDRRHGWEVLPTNKEFYHVQGGEMINMVGCLEPMIDFCGEMISIIGHTRGI